MPSKNATTPTWASIRADGGPVDPRCPCPGVAGHPLPRVHQERPVIDEVEQVIEPAGAVSSRPTVQFGLHPPYRKVGRILVRPLRGAGIPRRVFGHYLPSLADTLPPFPMCTGSPRLGVLRRLRPTRAFGRRRAYPHPPRRLAGRMWSSHGWFPRSLLFGRRVRHSAIPLRHRHGYAVDIHHGSPNPGKRDPVRICPHESERVRTAIQPTSAGLRAGDNSRGVTTPIPLVYLPVSLTEPGPSGSAGPSRLCRGCSHPPRRLPDQAASSFIPPLRRRNDEGHLTPIRNSNASCRTLVLSHHAVSE